ncbi:hypothetical protein SPAN111604_03810 [Sphingomonas antarctica]|uniref:hypothetical protein n=1 Tax=Sphingomonas antarctica TaxID=2040274 RepID=UPI0039ED6DAA
MKKIAPRSLAPLLAAAALPFTPAVAQEVSLPTVSAPPAAAPAPAPAPQAAPAMVFAPQKAVVQAAPPPGPQADDLARQAQADAAARRTARRAPAPVRAAAPVRPATVTPAQAGAATNVNAPTPVAPVATAATPAATPPVNETPLVAAPAPTTPVATQQTTTTTQSSFNWLWAALGVGVLAVLGALVFFRRRRDEELVYDEPVYVEEPVYAEPVAVAEPLIAEPVVAEPLTTDRPQIEIGIRPIRAGSDNGQARVDYEVIVENAGALDARDVTVTSWLLNGESSDAERDIIESHVDVAAGEATTVVGTASVDTDRATFRPVVAADARYTLPDGSQGHIAARFAVGVDGGEPGRITPIVLDRDEMRNDLGARLEGEVERA